MKAPFRAPFRALLCCLAPLIYPLSLRSFRVRMGYALMDSCTQDDGRGDLARYRREVRKNPTLLA